ncbi:MAG: ATP-binding cassette domain-containing protein [Bacteroidetes bacterium]|nr:ATP-binding cassette domain-containing protein [Bacteroidota bacterium]
MNEKIVEIDRLVKRFPVGKSYFTAINGISLHIERGEFTGLIGPSGSGKTTLLNIIGTLDVPTEGEVHVLGHPVSRLGAREAAMLRRSER